MTLMWRSGTTCRHWFSLSTMQVPGGPNSTIRPDGTFSPEQPHLLERSFNVQLFTLFLSNRLLGVSKGKKKKKEKSCQVFLSSSSSTVNTSSKRQPEYQCPRCLPEQSLPVHVSCQSLPMNMYFCYTVMYLYKLYTQHSVFCTSQFLCCSPWCYICTL